MFACVDVDYRENGARAACILFGDWEDAEPACELIEEIAQVEPYEPGQFYKRELPCLRKVLDPILAGISMIIVDGYVWLDEERRPGLGAHLYEALEQEVPVVGVAKTGFATAIDFATPIYRGDSQRPLYVTSVGVHQEAVAQKIQHMHGQYRIPTLLKRVDQCCRGR